MAQCQAASAVPDAEKEFKIDTHYGRIILHQKTEAAALTEPDNTLITGMNIVTLTANWGHAGVPESRQVQFYVYRSGWLEGVPDASDLRRPALASACSCPR